jgi:hypothetical protein
MQLGLAPPSHGTLSRYQKPLSPREVTTYAGLATLAPALSSLKWIAVLGLQLPDPTHQANSPQCSTYSTGLPDLRAPSYDANSHSTVQTPTAAQRARVAGYASGLWPKGCGHRRRYLTSDYGVPWLYDHSVRSTHAPPDAGCEKNFFEQDD